MPRFRNPVIDDDEGIDHGDPFVLRYLDRYYLYHTSENRGPGVLVHSSLDLLNWELVGYALEPSKDRNHWAQTDLWAPEVMLEDGVFYMYVTGTRFIRGKGSDKHRRQGLARSTSPCGPFVLDDEPLIADEWTIDGHPLRDQDGITWLVYNTREQIWDPASQTSYLARQTGNVIDQLVAPDRLAGKPSIVSFPTEEWEGNGHFFWNEGAWVIKRSNHYHLLYSGCDYRDRGYAVGLLTATDVRGPWIKHPDNPLLRSGKRIIGPGHPSVTLAPDNVTPYIVYHAYVDSAKRGRKVHVDRIHWAADMPVIGRPAGTPTETYQRRPPQPVFDEDVGTWVADFWTQAAWCGIGGVRIEMDSGAVRRVRACNGVDELKVWIDDRLVYSGDPVNVPSITAEAEVQALSVTSCLEDDNEYVLEPDTERSWPWPGQQPADITLAVRGTCLVTLGSCQVQVERSPDRYELFRMAGVVAGKLRIRALGEGASVRSIFVVARDPEYLLSHPETPEPGGSPTEATNRARGRRRRPPK